MAREAGVKARGGTVSEAFPTMRRRHPSRCSLSTSISRRCFFPPWPVLRTPWARSINCTGLSKYSQYVTDIELNNHIYLTRIV